VVGEVFVKVFRVFAFAGLVLASAHSALAQQSIDYASISGRVTDPSGAAVPGAQVTARHTQTNLSSTAATDSDGRYRFPYLRVGSYVITVHQSGFTDVARSLTLTVGAAFDLPVALSLSGVTATVDVSGDATLLETARSQIAGTISEPEIRSLPLNGRNFLELALLVPGVSPTNVNSSQLFPETSAVPGVTLSVASQRNLSNNFVVDGLSANDDAAALSGITYAADAIEQFQIVTSGAQAELGRALGGYVNVVTRSGTNALHGSAYGYGRDDRFNATNAAAAEKLPMNQAQYGASVGGPIVRDQTFHFANLEQRRLDQTGFVTISAATAAAINARLMDVGYRGPAVTTGLYDNPVDSSNLLAKVDHAIGARDRLTVRYALFDVSSLNARGAGGFFAPSASSGLDNRDQTVAIGNTLTLSPRTVLESRAQFAHSDLAAPPTDPIGPTVSIAGVASFGTLSTSPTGRVNRMYQIVNNLSHHGGAHAFRAGVDVLVNDDRITFPRAIRGSFGFSSLATFLAGVYNNAGFTQTFGATAVAQSNANVGFYVQDEWKIGSKVTLNVGLRYDLQFLETLHTDRDNVSPRVGLTWSPFGSRRTVVRASAGLFYDRVPLRAVANALLSAGNTTDLANLRQIAVSLSPSQTAAPVFPSILGDIVPSVTLPSLTTIDRNLENAYSRQGSIEVERQIGARSTLSVGYQYVRGEDLLMSINQNVPSCAPAGNNNGCRPNPLFANNNQYSAAGTSNYHGLHVSFLQRPARWGHYRVSYTLSKSMNNLGEAFFSSPIDPFDLAKDWARSDDDQRHRLVIQGGVQASTDPAGPVWKRLIRGFAVSGMVQAYSALPFNITSGATTLQGTAGRPIVNGAFIDRNAGIGSDFMTVNARLSRAVAITERLTFDLLVEGFNLTNHTNVLTRNAVFGTGAYPTNPAANFRQMTAAAEPRAFQFGARVRF
jgi:hypothetical protein